MCIKSELVGLSSWPFNLIQSNNLIRVLALVLISLLSVNMPFGLVENHEHQDHETLLGYALNLGPWASLSKLCKRLKACVIAVFRQFKVLVKRSFSTLLSLLTTRIFDALTLRLRFLLSANFHEGKFKKAIETL